jgi:hypothetical protein
MTQESVFWLVWVLLASSGKYKSPVLPQPESTPMEIAVSKNRLIE